MKKVPLVIYKNGERIVVGEAVVDMFAEGHLGVVGKITKPQYADILNDNSASFSIGPMGETIEVAAIPPLKSVVREGYLAEFYRKNPPQIE